MKNFFSYLNLLNSVLPTMNLYDFLHVKVARGQPEIESRTSPTLIENHPLDHCPSIAQHLNQAQIEILSSHTTEQI